MRKKLTCLILSGLVASLFQVTYAANPAVTFEAGMTATSQSSNDSRIKDESLASFDLLTTVPAAGGSWTIYIEANASPGLNGVSSILGEANGDAGSALDRDGKGRFQVSELNYKRHMLKGNLVAGLINVAGFLDGNDVANDETMQFISTTLVNNPTIAMPDYTPGLAYYRTNRSITSGFTLVATSSHGIADNPNASYSELFDVSETTKGMFLAVEGFWQWQNTQLQLGAWNNSSDHSYLDSTSGTADNTGVYANLSGTLGEGNWNLRLGMADKTVSEAAEFASLAYQYPLKSVTLGIGTSQTILSSKAAAVGKDDTSQSEFYARFKINNDLSLTPSIQILKNSGFDSTSTTRDADMTVYTLRLTYSLF